MPSLLMLKALPWKLIGFAAIALALISMFAALQMEKRKSDKLSNQLQAVIEQSKKKQIEVREVIKQGKDRIVVVERDAKKVEEAPLEGECKTPRAVIEADV